MPHPASSDYERLVLLPLSCRLARKALQGGSLLSKSAREDLISYCSANLIYVVYSSVCRYPFP